MSTVEQIWTGTGLASLATLVAAWVALGGIGPPPVATTCPTNLVNTAGGPDPWGGCWPGIGNTGVPAGTTLTPYTGSCDVTIAGTVIDSKVIDCPSGEGACRVGYCMNIKAPNVTIRNSLVNGSVWIDDQNLPYSFTITDSTINVGPIDQLENNAPTAIGKSHFVATRVETFNGGRGIWCEYDCKVVDSYVHGQDADEGGATHESGIRQGSGAPIPGGGGSNGGVQTFRHNTVICEAPDVPPDAGCSADFTGYGDFNYIQYNSVDRNLLLSTTGGTCAYGGNTTPRPFADGSHNVWTDNIFQRGTVRGASDGQGHCGYWFGMAHWDGTLPGNVFTGNLWDDGTDVVPNT